MLLKTQVPEWKESKLNINLKWWIYFYTKIIPYKHSCRFSNSEYLQTKNPFLRIVCVLLISSLSARQKTRPRQCILVLFGCTLIISKLTVNLKIFTRLAKRPKINICILRGIINISNNCSLLYWFDVYIKMTSLKWSKVKKLKKNYT